MSAVWIQGLRTLLLFGVFINLALVIRRRAPWGSIAFAVIVLILGLLCYFNMVPMASRLALVGVLDACLAIAVITAVVTGRQNAISTAFPRRLFHLIESEMRIARFALLFPRLLTTHRYMSVETYSERSKWESFAVLAFVSFVPDVFIVLMLPLPVWIHTALIAISTYVTMWCVGAFGAAVLLPHVLDAEQLIFRNGLFAEIRVPAGAVVGASLVPESERLQVLRKNSLARSMFVPGTPIVKVSYKGAAIVQTLFASKPAELFDGDLYIPSDLPIGLINVLQSSRLCAGRPGALADA